MKCTAQGDQRLNHFPSHRYSHDKSSSALGLQPLQPESFTGRPMKGQSILWTQGGSLAGPHRVRQPVDASHHEPHPVTYEDSSHPQKCKNMTTFIQAAQHKAYIQPS